MRSMIKKHACNKIHQPQHDPYNGDDDSHLEDPVDYHAYAKDIVRTQVPFLRKRKPVESQIKCDYQNEDRYGSGKKVQEGLQAY